MALVPSLWRDWWVDFDRPHRFLDDHFGVVLSRRDLLRALDLPWPIRSYFRPWRCLIDHCPPPAKIRDDGSKFQVILDVEHFSPNEIIVRTVDNSIIVEAKHEEHQDCCHRFVSREFMRRYDLPEGIDVSRVMSNLSTNGVLTITAPRFPLRPLGERIVPVDRLHYPALKS